MDVKTDELIDVQDLLDMVYNHEVGCEHPHNLSKCSEVVTARIIACNKQYNVCSNIETIVRGLIVQDENTCAGCKKNVGNCWRVNAI